MRLFEQPDNLLPNTWVVVRLDGRAFTKFATKYGFKKPNDKRALDLMNAAAKSVITELPDITIAYGVSDEFRYQDPVESFLSCHPPKMSSPTN